MPVRWSGSLHWTSSVLSRPCSSRSPFPASAKTEPNVPLKAFAKTDGFRCLWARSGRHVAKESEAGLRERSSSMGFELPGFVLTACGPEIKKYISQTKQHGKCHSGGLSQPYTNVGCWLVDSFAIVPNFSKLFWTHALFGRFTIVAKNLGGGHFFVQKHVCVRKSEHFFWKNLAFLPVPKESNRLLNTY